MTVAVRTEIHDHMRESRSSHNFATERDKLVDVKPRVDGDFFFLCIWNGLAEELAWVRQA